MPALPNRHTDLPGHTSARHHHCVTVLQVDAAWRTHGQWSTVFSQRRRSQPTWWRLGTIMCPRVLCTNVAAPPHISWGSTASIVGCVRHTKPVPTDKVGCAIQSRNPKPADTPRTDTQRTASLPTATLATLFIFLFCIHRCCNCSYSCCNWCSRPCQDCSCRGPTHPARLARPCQASRAPRCNPRDLTSLLGPHGWVLNGS
jgi:hypothetical protein